MKNLSLGWQEAVALVSIPYERPDHSPWFGCDCLLCVRHRRDVDKYGYDSEGRVELPRGKPTLPWEEAA